MRKSKKEGDTDADPKKMKAVRAGGIHKNTQQTFEALVSCSPVAIIAVDPAGNVTSWNPAAERIFGWKASEVLGSPNPIVPDEKQGEFHLLLNNILEGTACSDVETTRRRKDGSDVEVRISASPVFHARGEINGVMAVIDDITEQKRAEEKLRESEKKFHDLFESSQDVILLLDRAGNIININPRAATLTGYTQAELCEMNVFDDLIVAEDHPIIRQAIQDAFEGRTSTYEERWKTKGGAIIWVEGLTLPRRSARGEVLSTFCTLRNITERKRAEEELRKSECRFKELFDSTLDGIYQTDANGIFTVMNRAGAKIFGYDSPEEIIGRSVLEYWRDPKDRDAFIAQLRARKSIGSYRMAARKKNGEPIALEASSTIKEDEKGDILGIEGILRDVTERNHLEAQLRHAQKMEAIGQLAGGVAHDFNNILTAIIGYSALGETKLPGDHPVRLYMQQILQSSERAAALTQSLLAFSRKRPLRLELLGINEIIGKFETFLIRLLREDIELVVHYAEEELNVLADRGQIEQVVMNLVTNARDAMPDKGRLSIATMHVVLGQDFMNAHGYGRIGDFALISVTDSGIGMDEQTRQKIFEPFFTTKEVGKGTGLGLATVYGIVKSHDGFINVYSEPDKGTSFKVYLPIAHPAGDMRAPAVQQPEELQGGAETILLAEDDKELLTMTSIVLKEMGYTVIQASDGNEAVNKFVENKDSIRLVILDGIMPGKNGKEVYNEVAALCPDVRCLFVSGYAEDIFTKDGILRDEAAFLTKPITPSVLLKKVREVLDR